MTNEVENNEYNANRDSVIDKEMRALMNKVGELYAIQLHIEMQLYKYEARRCIFGDTDYDWSERKALALMTVKHQIKSLEDQIRIDGNLQAFNDLSALNLLPNQPDSEWIKAHDTAVALQDNLYIAVKNGNISDDAFVLLDGQCVDLEEQLNKLHDENPGAWIR